MRKFLSSILLAALLVTAFVVPAAAQENAAQGAPGPAQTSVYLPVVAGGAGQEQEQPGEGEVLVFPGAISIDEEPVFDVPPKASAVSDPEPEANPAPEPTEKPESVAPAALDGWQTILNDGFEGVPWPAAPVAGQPRWSTFDANGATNGTYYWDDEAFRPYRGGYSAWPAGNALNPATANHAPNMRSWMTFGPFSLRDAAKATLTFQYYLDSELNYDYFGWFASPDGTRFYGNWATGRDLTWRPGVIDFQNVPGYGSMLGDASVWIGFYFYSDGSTQFKGVNVDDVFVQKFACPNQFTAYWYNAIAPSPTTQRAVTCESYPFAQNWSTTNEPWTGPDNWSLQLAGRPYFNAARTWTFEARSDDGVKVWVDGHLVIDKYFDQNGTATHRGTIYLAAGYHDVFVQYYERTGGAMLSVRWY